MTKLKGPRDYNRYPYNLETVIIKYNEDKEEGTAITISGEKKKQILEMLSRVSEHWRYDGRNFNYDYKIDIGNIIVYYLDVDEKILESDGFYEITEKECGQIEALFVKN